MRLPKGMKRYGKFGPKGYICYDGTEISEEEYKRRHKLIEGKTMEQTEAKSHYVNLAGVVLPGFYVAKLETREGAELCLVRVDLTMFGNGTKKLAMFHTTNEGAEVPLLVSDSSTYFGPLPLE